MKSAPLLSQFTDLQTQLLRNFNSLLLMGDFNFRAEVVTWGNSAAGVIPIPSNIRNDPIKIQFQNLLDITDKHFLHQTVTGKTTLANTLDLILTNTPNILHSLEILPTTSDHHLIHFQTELTQEVNQNQHATADSPEISKFNFNRANLESIRAHLIEFNLSKIAAQSNTVAEAKNEIINKIVSAARLANTLLKDTSTKPD